MPNRRLDQELKVEYMEGDIEITLALGKVYEKLAGEMDVLEVALEREYMSCDFYKGTSALVEEPDAKALLHELALEKPNDL